MKRKWRWVTKAWGISFLCWAMWWSLGTGMAAVQSAKGPTVDVLRYEVDAELDLERSTLRGEGGLFLRFLEDTPSLELSFSRHLSVISATDSEGRRLSLGSAALSRDAIRLEPETPWRAGNEAHLVISFEGSFEPEQYAFLDTPQDKKALLDRDGGYLLTEAFWFPSHQLPVDPAEVSLRVVVPLGFTVVGPGELAAVETLGLTEAFQWASRDPVNSAPLFIGRFFRQSFEEKSPKLVFFVQEESADKDLSPLAELVWEILAFYEEEFGRSGLETLTVVQTRNLAITPLGSRGLLPLELRYWGSSLPPWRELAYRLALQWWGYGVLPERAGDAWLADGFATYAALCFGRANRSDEYSTELAKTAVEALKYQEQAPVADGFNLERGSARYQSIVAAKGGWILFMLEQLLGQDKIKAVLQEFYANHAGLTGSTREFARLIDEAAGEDYRWFFTQWLESVGVPELRLEYTILKLREGGFRIRGRVLQDLEMFRMPLEILVETKGQPEEKKILVSGKVTSFAFETETLPVRLVLDPHGKVLRDSDRMRVAVSIAMGDEYRERGEYVSAIREYERALELNPRNSLAHFRLGQTFFEQHSYSNAANSMREALNGDLQPEWIEVWAHIYLGKVYDILGQRRRAEAEYQKALNTKVDYNGSLAEAQKYLEEPFSQPSSVLG
ncbi:MAG TPA: tetratricopeptide repeat protein [Acidobacteriota bacterium]|nr:tetratricopeptide repeat protein [Acidobacteriota bacterium]